MLKLLSALSLTAALCAGCASTRPASLGWAPPTKLNACGATSHPETGLLALNDPVQWFKVKARQSGMEAFVACLQTQNESGERFDLVLIAGPIGDPTSSDSKLKGIKPPEREDGKAFKPGVSICHYKGSYNDGTCVPEIVRLHGGFLYVSATPSKSDTSAAERAINPWPFIVRTPAMPAGPRASKFVMLNFPDHFGGTLSEHLFRPNQSQKSCGSFTDPNGETGAEVLALAAGQVHVLKSVCSLTTPSTTPQPATLTPSEENFLKAVCEFVEDVYTSEPGEPYTWPCGSETHEKR